MPTRSSVQASSHARVLTVVSNRVHECSLKWQRNAGTGAEEKRRRHTADTSGDGARNDGTRTAEHIGSPRHRVRRDEPRSRKRAFEPSMTPRASDRLGSDEQTPYNHGREQFRHASPSAEWLAVVYCPGVPKQ